MSIVLELALERLNEWSSSLFVVILLKLPSYVPYVHLIYVIHMMNDPRPSLFSLPFIFHLVSTNRRIKRGRPGGTKLKDSYCNFRHWFLEGIYFKCVGLSIFLMIDHIFFFLSNWSINQWWCNDYCLYLSRLVDLMITMWLKQLLPKSQTHLVVKVHQNPPPKKARKQERKQGHLPNTRSQKLENRHTNIGHMKQKFLI